MDATRNNPSAPQRAAEEIRWSKSDGGHVAYGASNPFRLHMAEVERATNELLIKFQIQCEELTERQIAEAFKQALLSGDFVKYVRLGTPHSQAVIYAPFAQVERLKSKIERLEKLLADNGIQIPDEECE